MRGIDLQLKSDPGSMWNDAAAVVAGVVRTRPSATLALPTGRTPLSLYAELILLHRAGALDFSESRIFSLDEYLGLQESDPRTFRNYLWTYFLSYINVRPDNVILAPAIRDAGRLEAYEDAIRAAGGLDLVILGLGSNGHIAFNEPGSPFDSRTRVVDLAESTVRSLAGAFSGTFRPTHAVTIGIGTILEARRILMLVHGETKKMALQQMLYGPIGTDVPATALRLHRNVTVMAEEYLYVPAPEAGDP